MNENLNFLSFYFHAQNLSVKNGENNGVLAGVPFLSSSRAQIPHSPSPFNACHEGYKRLEKSEAILTLLDSSQELHLEW